MKREKHLPSIHAGLLTAVLLCWVLPVMIVMVLAGVLIGQSYEHSSRQELESRANNALEQIGMRLDAVFEASKAVSYDGVVRNSYRLYQREGDKAVLYRTVTDYLNQNFTRDERVLSAFITFWEDIGVYPYAASRGDQGYSAQREYRDTIEPDLLERMGDIDTGILLLEYGGELYVARNLLDSRFQPYATVTLLCDREVLFQSMEPVKSISKSCSLTLDDRLLLGSDGTLTTLEQLPPPSTGSVFTDEVSGHTLCLTALIAPFDFWRDVPEIRTAALFVALLAIPLLFVVVLLFRRFVAKPMDALILASRHLQEGERGYRITEKPNSREFKALFGHFNTMSAELKNQFERSYQEQQALQQARIKALQSQINPHFLNNTLEIINWEARIAGDERVSAMIESLSIMMDGALARDGRTRIPLKEELRYTDAYLYIIRERLGEKLTVVKEIDEGLDELLFPRLCLQPLAENAVEHDLTPKHGGELCIRIRREEGTAVVEVEHEGVLTPEDLANITSMLAANEGEKEISGHVGLKNLRQRLNLLYGEKGTLSLTQVTPERILAKVTFPIES